MSKKLLNKISIIIIIAALLAIIFILGCNSNELANKKGIKNQEDYAYKMDKVEGIPEGSGKVDYNFDLQLVCDNEPREIIAGNFLVLYQIGTDEKFLLIIENLYPDLIFSGTIKASLLSADSELVDYKNFQLYEFKQNDIFRENISFRPDADILNLEVVGIFEK